jgi:diphthamide biosynthesis protein 2
VEKARGAAILGLLVSTLSGSDRVQAALRVLRRLIAAAGKRSYTVLIGKPNPAKLANFPEARGPGGRMGIAGVGSEDGLRR